MNIVSKQLQALVTWSVAPSPGKVQGLLEALTPGDLMIAMTYLQGAVAHLAWAEYGRRINYIKFELVEVVADGELVIRYVGDAKPIHDGIIFDVKEVKA
jgi:hypothetical protein